MERRRGLVYALLTAVPAVLGLLLIRAAFSFVPSLTFEFFTNRLTYIYVFVATALVFMVLGYVLGRRIDEFRRLSTTDPLTGLANQRAFQARLRDEWQRARRYTSPLSLLLIDIDGLKRINDERGHAAGDQILGAAAHRSMRRCGSQTLARAEAVTSLPSWRQTPPVDRFSGSHNGCSGRCPGKRGLGTVAVTISVGVATLEPESDTSASVEWLQNAADAALYQAKSEGRNHVNVA